MPYNDIFKIGELSAHQWVEWGKFIKHICDLKQMNVRKEIDRIKKEIHNFEKKPPFDDETRFPPMDLYIDLNGPVATTLYQFYISIESNAGDSDAAGKAISEFITKMNTVSSEECADAGLYCRRTFEKRYNLAWKVNFGV